MKIQILPCLVCIVDSVVVDRLIGFDDLGGTDQFTMKQLEDRLASQSSTKTIFVFIVLKIIYLGILQIPLRLKKSLDRRDRDSDNDDD